jgi:uncharacterized protein
MRPIGDLLGPGARLSILAAVAILSGEPDGAHAQCASDASTCVDCHEIGEAPSALRDGRPWHVDHGFGDLCAACHGGDPAATAAAAAHVGLRAPLDDPGAACAGCHGAETERLVARYRDAVAAGAGHAGDAPAAASGAAVVSGTPDGSGGSSSAASTSGSATVAVVALILLLAAALLLLLFRDRARRPPLRSLAWLRAPRWPPAAAGAMLGVVVAIAAVAAGHPVAAAGAFDRLAAYAGVLLAPDSPYYGHVMRPAIGWQIWTIVGLFAGAAASARLSGTAAWRWLPDAQWIPRSGGRRARRLAIAFAGGFLVQLGADIAGGCTSGLAISGGVLLAPAAFLFMAGMFAGGIPTAWLWHRRGAP